MSEKKEEDGFIIGLVRLILGFFKGLATKVKLFLAGIFGLLGFISFIFLKNKINEKEILKLEVNKLKKQIEIEKNQAVIDQNNEMISSLETREEELRNEVKNILTKEKGREVSLSELDAFFDERGF